MSHNGRPSSVVVDRIETRWIPERAETVTNDGMLFEISPKRLPQRDSSIQRQQVIHAVSHGDKWQSGRKFVNNETRTGKKHPSACCQIKLPKRQQRSDGECGSSSETAFCQSRYKYQSSRQGPGNHGSTLEYNKHEAQQCHGQCNLYLRRTMKDDERSNESVCHRENIKLPRCVFF